MLNGLLALKKGRIELAIRDAVEQMRKEAKPFWLESVEKYLIQGNENIPNPGRFRPSSISPCARQNLFDYLGVARYSDHSLRTMKYFARGIANQNIWEGILRSSGLKLITPCSVCFQKGLTECSHTHPQPWSKENPNVRGTPDIIIARQNGDIRNLEDLYLLEWKSTGYYRTEWAHYLQWQLYSHFTGIKKGWIVNQDPNSWDTPYHDMEYNAKFVGQILEWLLFIQKCAENKEMISIDERCGPGKKWDTKCEIYDFCHSKEASDPWSLPVISNTAK